MRDYKKRATGLLTATDDLRKLILENPDIPLLVFAGRDCNYGDWSYVSCSHCSALLGEFLDCVQEIDIERCYTDRDDFEEAVRNEYDDFDGSDAEFEQLVEDKLVEYEPFWKPCIILYVDN